ncbi:MULTISPECIES: hypothetical protein [unclassified Moorena]|uniref:hypothetical protein n=1 Tax=unclassified Moorena TaxID=2683338 RepID=UPI0013FFE47D|nr:MULTISPECIES: hypothetical protein [unclassified Moorena]NEP97674.1 hypothetical protein [Moorena sp. SIO3F7]
MQSLMAHGSVCGTCVRTCLDAVAHGGNPRMKALHRSPAPWKPSQLLMGETPTGRHWLPKTA